MIWLVTQKGTGNAFHVGFIFEMTLIEEILLVLILSATSPLLVSKLSHLNFYSYDEGYRPQNKPGSLRDVLWERRNNIILIVVKNLTFWTLLSTHQVHTHLYTQNVTWNLMWQVYELCSITPPALIHTWSPLLLVSAHRCCTVAPLWLVAQGWEALGGGCWKAWTEKSPDTHWSYHCDTWGRDNGWKVYVGCTEPQK